ncbi:MAG TPA: hypothetical protein VFU88_21600 [Ktedonobacterales bacterium]|nr:hypothetical protein [Ktedonobacterales bacterium]
MSSTPPPGPKPSSLDPNVLAAVYQSLATRRLGYDTLMWQVPVLSLTAQAFLLTIALGASSLPAARLVAALLSFLVASISLQLMAKHRHNEEVDARLAERLERELHFDTAIGFIPHVPPRLREAYVGVRANALVRRSSYKIWRFGLALFAVAAFGIIVVTVIGLIGVVPLPSWLAL